MTSPIGTMSDAGIAQLLKKKGINPAEIQSFLSTGHPSVNITRILSPGQIQQVSSGVTRSNPFGLNQGARNNVAAALAPKAISARGVVDGSQQTTTQIGGKAWGTTGGLNAGRSVAAPVANAGSNTSNRQSLLNKISDALNLRNKVVGNYNAAASRQGSAAKENPIFQSGQGADDLTLPDSGVSQYTAPEISMRDFSDQANALSAQAYGPLFEAIAAGKTNAQGQYNTSDQVVKGLYDKLVSDTQASGVQQGQQYDQASTEAAGRAKALQDRQAQVYGESANTQTALLKSLGQEQSAPQVIAGGLNEQAFQQSQAAQQGDAQQQYYQAGKQNSNDYTTGIANAQNTQGTVAREGLVRDLATVLSQFDSQAAQGKTQQATTALDLGNQLSSRDLQVQTANASNQMGAAQMNQSAQQQALAAQQNAQQFGYQQQRDARSDFESDRNYGLQENQFKLDNAAAQAEAQGAQGSTGGGFIPIGEQGFDTQSAPQQVVAQADSIDPGNGQSYIGLFNSIVQGLQGNLELSVSDFARMAAQEAQKNGLSQAAAYAAAATYWKKIMNRS